MYINAAAALCCINGTIFITIFKMKHKLHYV